MLTQGRTELQVKHWTLAQEMRYIRRKEIARRKTLKRMNPDWVKAQEDGAEVSGIRKYIKKPNWHFDTAGREKLRDHRLNLKPLARGIHLARGYLQGMPYRVMERMAMDSPDWKIVWDHVVRFGHVDKDDPTARQKFMDWADVVLPVDPARLTNQRNQDYTADSGHPPSWHIWRQLKWT